MNIANKDILLKKLDEAHRMIGKIRGKIKAFNNCPVAMTPETNEEMETQIDAYESPFVILAEAISDTIKETDPL